MTQCNCRGGPNCCMRRGVPAPLPPDQIKPLPLSVGVEEGRGGARKAPPPPPPAPEGWAVPEIRPRRPSALTDVTIERTLNVIDRYHVTWPTRSGLTQTGRTFHWTARLKARRMQRRINAAREFNA